MPPSTTPPTPDGDYFRFLTSDANHTATYPVGPRPNPALYHPAADWIGRLILPAPGERDTVMGTLMEVQLAPSSYEALVGQIVRLRWETTPETNQRFWSVTRSVEFDKDAKKDAQNGSVLPERVNHWPLVNPLESLSGAYPANEMIVRLPDPVHGGTKGGRRAADTMAAARTHPNHGPFLRFGTVQRTGSGFADPVACGALQPRIRQLRRAGRNRASAGNGSGRGQGAARRQHRPPQIPRKRRRLVYLRRAKRSGNVRRTVAHAARFAPRPARTNAHHARRQAEFFAAFELAQAGHAGHIFLHAFMPAKYPAAGRNPPLAGRRPRPRHPSIRQVPTQGLDVAAAFADVGAFRLRNGPRRDRTDNRRIAL